MYNPATKKLAMSFGRPMQAAPKPPSIHDRFVQAGGQYPKGLVDDPSRDAYVKGHMRYNPQQGWNLGQYYTPPAQVEPAQAFAQYAPQAPAVQSNADLARAYTDMTRTTPQGELGQAWVAQGGYMDRLRSAYERLRAEQESRFANRFRA